MSCSVTTILSSLRSIVGTKWGRTSSYISFFLPRCFVHLFRLILGFSFQDAENLLEQCFGLSGCIGPIPECFGRQIERSCQSPRLRSSGYKPESCRGSQTETQTSTNC